MIESKKNQAALGIVGGLVVAVAGSPMHLDGPLRIVWTSVGVGLYAWGAMSLAEAKGYSRWWGLLALVTIVGMLVLVLMPDRHRNGLPIDGWPADHSATSTHSSSPRVGVPLPAGQRPTGWKE